MENLYSRIENLDEAVRSVKLPYMAWKVLFLIDKDTQVSNIAVVLEADEEEVKSSVSILLENGLIIEGKADDAVKEEATVAEEPEPDTEKAETEPEVKEEQEPEPKDEEKPEKDTKETAESEADLESEIDAAISADTDFGLEDDLVEEETADETENELEIEAEEDEIEIPEEEETDENIEINISDEETSEEVAGDKAEEVVDEAEDDGEDMEFNFNLTGEEGEVAEAETAEKKVETPAEEKVETVAEPPEEEKPKSKEGQKQILVIDDSLVIRKMVEIALEEEDFSIVTAVSGKEGLDALDKNNPDLVILDMMLPDINGIEILKTIKASKGIPVIMLSGKDSPQMIETAKNEGAEEFLPKPFKDDDLVEKIKKLL